MAINTIHATIQVRYGAEEDLDPDQLTTGEWAAATDTKKVWMCFRPGLVLRMATYEGFEQDMKEIQDMLVECRDIQTAVERFMQLAVQHKNDAAEYSALSESYSHQAKEEADRAREEADRAAAIAGFNVDSALSETSVDPVQNRVITKELSNKLDKTGDASEVTVTFEKAKTRTNIFSKDSLRTIIGKIQKWFDDLPSTRIIGVINILTDINQINDAYRNWRIASIDSEYAGEIGLDKNTGDFYATLLSYNGDGINFNYGNIILSSPRLGNDFYLLQIWSGVVHATYSRADVPIVTNNDLATIPGTAWDAVRGAQIRKDLDKLNSDLKKSGIMDNLLLTTRINDSFMFEDLIRKQSVTFFTNWTDKTNFPVQYGSGIVLPAEDSRNRYIIYTASSGLYYGYYYANNGVTWTKIIK